MQNDALSSTYTLCSSMATLRIGSTARLQLLSWCRSSSCIVLLHTDNIWSPVVHGGFAPFMEAFQENKRIARAKGQRSVPSPWETIAAQPPAACFTGKQNGWSSAGMAHGFPFTRRLNEASSKAIGAKELQYKMQGCCIGRIMIQALPRSGRESERRLPSCQKHSCFVTKNLPVGRQGAQTPFQSPVLLRFPVLAPDCSPTPPNNSTDPIQS